MDASAKRVIQKKRGRPPNPFINSVVALRLGADLELQLEHWRSLQPNLPSRSRAIRILMRKGLAAAEKEGQEASQNSG